MTKKTTFKVGKTFKATEDYQIFGWDNESSPQINTGDIGKLIASYKPGERENAACLLFLVNGKEILWNKKQDGNPDMVWEAV